jgi:hypothetical protein
MNPNRRRRSSSTRSWQIPRAATRRGVSSNSTIEGAVPVDLAVGNSRTRSISLSRPAPWCLQGAYVCRGKRCLV